MRAQHSRAVALLTALGFAASLVAVTTPAQAHYIREDAVRWTDNDNCAEAAAEVSHGDYNQGYGRWGSESTREGFGGANCLEPHPLPARELAVEPYWHAMAKPGYDICILYDWSYSNSRMWTLKVAKHYLVPACGADWYSTTANSWMWWNGAWHGGSLWSGNLHWFCACAPGERQRTAAMMGVDLNQPPGRPDWVNADGSVDPVLTYSGTVLFGPPPAPPKGVDQ